MRPCDRKGRNGHLKRPTPFSWPAPPARTWIFSSPMTNGSRASTLTASSSSSPWGECLSEVAGEGSVVAAPDTADLSAPMIPIAHPFRKVREKDGAPTFLLCRHQGEPDFPLANRTVGRVLSRLILGAAVTNGRSLRRISFKIPGVRVCLSDSVRG